MHLGCPFDRRRLGLRPGPNQSQKKKADNRTLPFSLSPLHHAMRRASAAKDNVEEKSQEPEHADRSSDKLFFRRITSNGIERVLASFLVMGSVTQGIRSNDVRYLYFSLLVSFNLLQSTFTGFCPPIMIMKRLGILRADGTCAW